ncbi:MAG TPA: hypothetical protein IAA98_03725 [Candidatus Avipropionibacterium avicola]|uniref:Aldose 1-epimerase n=1 Tax=Candidatus Avipropionibacterium avicola TaxID=2840701 RepID=A0A9D1KMW0_9ACTN|nr:hypothetical protein [Candidatus Avipropionibacterium avicola]
MTELVTLTSPDGRTTAAVQPSAGGRLVSLVVGGIEVIADVEPRSAADFYRGSFPLAPWCGTLTGTPDLTRDLRPGALSGQHGLVHSWPFQIDTVSPHLVEQSIQIGPDQPDQWPWRGFVTQRYELTDTTLITQLAVHSHGDAFSASAGFHPWFITRLDDDPARTAVVDFRPGRQLTMDENGQRTIAGAPTTPMSGVFDQIAQNPTINWPVGPSLTLTSNTEIWVTYEQGPGFCVEPWTAPDGPVDGPHLQQVTADSPCVLDFSIIFSAPGD